jgi:hypothetical protein
VTEFRIVNLKWEDEREVERVRFDKVCLIALPSLLFRRTPIASYKIALGAINEYRTDTNQLVHLKWRDIHKSRIARISKKFCCWVSVILNSTQYNRLQQSFPHELRYEQNLRRFQSIYWLTSCIGTSTGPASALIADATARKILAKFVVTTHRQHSKNWGNYFPKYLLYQTDLPKLTTVKHSWDISNPRQD